MQATSEIEISRPGPWGRAAGTFAVSAALLMIPSLVLMWMQYAVQHAHIRAGRTYATSAEAAAALPQWEFPIWPAVAMIVAATASMLVWVHRVRGNAAVLAPQHRFRFSRTLAVAGLALPFANLWWSRPVLEDIWAAGRRGSDPGTGLRVLRLWRICLGSAFLLLALALLFPGPDPEDTLLTDVDGQPLADSSTLFHVTVVDVVRSAGVAALLTAALLLVMVVSLIERQQSKPVTSGAAAAAEAIPHGRVSKPWMKPATLVSCAIPTLFTTVMGLAFAVPALRSGLSAERDVLIWSPLFWMASLFFWAQAAVLVPTIVGLARQPHRYAHRMTGSLCVVAGTHVMLLPLFSFVGLPAILVLLSLTATAAGLVLLERICGGGADR
jgi:hypothetical protein